MKWKYFINNLRKFTNDLQTNKRIDEKKKELMDYLIVFFNYKISITYANVHAILLATIHI